jgi:peptide/nickel transport system ATP-binding protein
MYLGRIAEIGPVEAIYDNPRHPYTQALFSARLSMDPECRTEATVLQGDPPNPINPPSGCRFRTRCPMVQDICTSREPQLVDLGGGHEVACHLYDAASADLQGRRHD